MTRRAREIERKIDGANCVLRSTGTALDDLLGEHGNSGGDDDTSVSSDSDAALSKKARPRKKRKGLEMAILEWLDSMIALMLKAEEGREREAERRERKDAEMLAMLEALAESVQGMAMGTPPPPYQYHQRRGDCENPPASEHPHQQ